MPGVKNRPSGMQISIESRYLLECHRHVPLAVNLGEFCCTEYFPLDSQCQTHIRACKFPVITSLYILPDSLLM
jgi:hypothetical protein